MNHHTTLSNPHNMDLVQWQRLKENPQCSQSTLVPLESNGQEFDLKLLNVFLGISLFLSILLSLCLKGFLSHVENVELETANA